MKKNDTFRKFFNKAIVLPAALMFGFCENIAAQYGVVVDFLIKGRVVSQTDNQAIPGIKLAGSKNNFSNEDGTFEFHAKSMSDDIRLIFNDIDGEKNGRFLPFDTLVESSDNLVVRLKPEPEIKDFLNENPDFPEKSNGKNIVYTKFMYFSRRHISMQLAGLNAENHHAYRLSYNGKVLSPVEGDARGIVFDFQAKTEKNRVCIELLALDKVPEKEIVTISDGYESYTWEIKPDSKNIQALIIILY